MDDWQLLQDYVGCDSQIAFSTLVNRYVNLVYSVAIRQTHDAQLAQEVAQAVFILLARKARSFRRSIILSGWLFRTTRFVASRAIRGEQRRQRREQEAHAMQQLSTPDDTWKRVSPVLDEALERLGETDRNALLLRFFNEQSFRETAVALGMSEDAAKKRVTRALDKLRHFLTTRGVTLSATALASVLSANAAKAATPEVAASVVSKLIAGGASAIGSSLPLVAQTLSAWRWMKLKIAGATGVTVVMTALLLQWSIGKQPDPVQISPVTQGDALSSAIVANQPAAAFEQSDSPFTTLAHTNGMLFRMMEVQTDVGISGAMVAVNYVSDGKGWAGKDLVTDADGICRVDIPDGLARLDVGVLKDGYVQKFYTWRKDSEEPLPSVYIFRVERAVAIGGYCRDEAGKPVSDAEIFVKLGQTSDSSGREPQPERLGFLRDLVIAKSDAQGRWRCAIVPPDYDQFQVEARHPQFVEGNYLIDRRYASDPKPRPELKALLAFEAVIVLRPGFQIRGVVLDDTGRPVSEAKVSRFDETGWPLDSMTTKADGLFRLHGVGAGLVVLGASAPGFAPVNRTLDLRTNVSNLTFQLNRGTNVSVRVVDEQGDGVAGAWVAAEGPLKHNADWHVKSDAQGWARIDGIPDAVRDSLWFHVGANGFFTTRNRSVNLSASEPTIQLVRALKVSGRVVDAVSGEPINSFKAMPSGLGGSFDRSERKLGTNGNFAVAFNEYQMPFRVRIEAEGYEPLQSLPLAPVPSEQFIELKLLRKDPSKVIRGMVLLSGDQPAANAEVALLTFERGASLYEGRFLDQSNDSILTRTDSEGRFQFEFDVHAHTIAVAHDAGFGWLRIRPEEQGIVVRLSPWGRIEGRVRTQDGEWSARDVVLTSSSWESGFSVSSYTKSAHDGSFVMDRIPAGDYALHLNPGTGKSFTHTTPTQVNPGETSKAQIGGTGATVTGRLEYAGHQVDWKEQTKLPSLQPTNTPPPGPILWPFDHRSGDLEGRRKRLDQLESEGWRDWARTQRPMVALKIAADGSFVAESVRAGKYTLRVDLTAEAGGSRRNIMASLMKSPIASIRVPVEITEAQEQSMENLDLGVLTLQPAAQNGSEDEAGIAR